MRSRTNRPSPALVISVVALFVSLGGTGYAATQLAKCPCVSEPWPSYWRTQIP